METIRLDNVNRATYEKFVQDLQNAQVGGEVASRINGTRATLSITDAKGATLIVEFDLPQLDVPTANGGKTDWTDLTNKLRGMLNDLGQGGSSGGGRVSTGSLADIFKIFALLLQVAQKQSEAARKMAAADSQKMQAKSIAQGNERLATGAKASSEQMTGAIVSGVMCGISTVMSAASFGMQIKTMADPGVKIESTKLADVEKQFNSANKIDTGVDPDVKFSPEEQNVLFKGQHLEGDMTADEMFAKVNGQKPEAKPDNNLGIKNNENNINNDNNNPGVKNENDKNNINNDNNKLDLSESQKLDGDSEENLIDNQSKNENQSKLDNEIEMEENDELNNSIHEDDDSDEGPKNKLLDKSFSENDPEINKELMPENGMREKDPEILPEDNEINLQEENFGIHEEKGVISKETMKAQAAYDKAEKQVRVQEQALDKAKIAKAEALDAYDKNPTTENGKTLEDANKLVSDNEAQLDKAKLERAEKAVEFRKSLQADIDKYKEQHNVGLGMTLKNKFVKLSEADQIAFDNAKMLDRFQNSVDAKLRGPIVDGLRPQLMKFQSNYNAALDRASKTYGAIIGNAVGALAPLVKQFGDMGSAIKQAQATQTQAQGEAAIKFMEGEQEAIRGRLEQDRSAQGAAQDAVKTTLNALQQIMQIEAQSANATNI